MSQVSTGCVTILHLEDDSRDARLIKNHLMSDGLECVVVCVDCEADFRDAVRQGGFDIILADHSLPDIDGIRAMAIAREFCPSVPFICVSGSLGEELAIETMQSGATDYVLKHRLSRLGPAVRRALQESAERAKRRRAEAEVKTLEQQLRHSQKLEAVGQLAGGIAHDFNNLLTVINGYCERLLIMVNEDGPFKVDLELIHKAGQRAAGLTRQLLAFSRRQVLQPKVIELNTIVSDIQRILARVIGEQITVSTALDPALGLTKADPGQIEQVIMNLAINARDAMPEGGTITIETGNIAVDGESSSYGLRPGRYVVLAVRDTGHGMDETTASHIFEPFFTTKESGKGTGLGLSTVYGIVAQSGGDIAVESAPGRGTTMRVFLPRVEQVRAERPAAMAPQAMAYGSETLLLVEDEDFVRELVREFLQSAGYTVVEARSAEEALALAAADQLPPVDLLVTDVVLPGINGAKLAEKLRSIMPGVEALYISGYPGDAMFKGDRFDPGPAFLAKPFTRHVLTGKVREMLNARPPAMATVLVVEPDADIRRLLVHMLATAGYSVVDRVEVALDPKSRRRPVDVALVDLTSTHQHATIHAIRSRFPRAQVVVMAGAFAEDALGQGSGLGLDVRLQKPLNEASVLDAVARALANQSR